MTAPSRSDSSFANRAVRLAVAVQHRIGDADPALSRTHVGVLEPRHELRDCPLDGDLVVGLNMRRRALLAARPGRSAAARASRRASASRYAVSRNPRRRHTICASSFDASTSSVTVTRALRLCVTATHSRSSAFATPCRRPARSRTWTSWMCARPRTVVSMRATPDGPSRSSARKTPPVRMSSSVSGHSSSHVSGSSTSHGVSASNSSQSARSGASSASVAGRIVSGFVSHPASR